MLAGRAGRNRNTKSVRLETVPDCRCLPSERQLHLTVFADARTNPAGGRASKWRDIHLIQPLPRHEGQPQPPPGGRHLRKRRCRLPHYVGIKPPRSPTEEPQHRLNRQHLRDMHPNLYRDRFDVVSCMPRLHTSVSVFVQCTTFHRTCQLAETRKEHFNHFQLPNLLPLKEHKTQNDHTDKPVRKVCMHVLAHMCQ